MPHRMDPSPKISADQFPARLQAALQLAAEVLGASLRDRQQQLADAAPIDAQREAETLLLACLSLPRSTLYSDPDRILTAAERERCAHWLARRATGEPLAYLTGEREFWSLALKVSPAVLVPRPETELLVEHALQAGRSIGLPLRALDLGTGSGAIAIALAHENPNWRVTAIDRSSDALEIARHNALRHAAQSLEFLLGDWYQPVGNRRFHLIVSNPPYVAADDPVLDGDSLRHEPRVALTPGGDAFADLARIVAHAPLHLEHGGYLLLEHGTTQAATVRRMLVAQGFAHVVSHRDLAGHERVTQGQLT